MKKDTNTSVIPKGIYCHGPLVETDKTAGNVPMYKAPHMCPYWSRLPDKETQEDGYCSFLQKGDGDFDEHGNLIYLLWDQVKECGINMETDEETEELGEASL